ncbi:hypothetical protein FRC03_001397 [Tulasnella sp. 419]|nr:hypothetical protein FRC03_001397 [Tulasnella sp. 419]
MMQPAPYGLPQSQPPLQPSLTSCSTTRIPEYSTHHSSVNANTGSSHYYPFDSSVNNSGGPARESTPWRHVPAEHRYDSNTDVRLADASLGPDLAPLQMPQPNSFPRAQALASTPTHGHTIGKNSIYPSSLSHSGYCLPLYAITTAAAHRTQNLGLSRDGAPNGSLARESMQMNGLGMPRGGNTITMSSDTRERGASIGTQTPYYPSRVTTSDYYLPSLPMTATPSTTQENGWSDTSHADEDTNSEYKPLVEFGPSTPRAVDQTPNPLHAEARHSSDSDLNTTGKKSWWKRICFCC